MNTLPSVDESAELAITNSLQEKGEKSKFAFF